MDSPTQLRCWGNVVGSREVRYLNVPMERLKELAIAQMKAGETVWLDRMSAKLATGKLESLRQMSMILKREWISS